MNSIEILPTIRSAMFDESRNASDARAYWRFGSEAIELAECGGNYIQIASNKIERASERPARISTAIGGLCSIFTGDLEWAQFRQLASGIVRMDQIVESVGNINGLPTFVIFEDSFFESLTGIPRTQFQKQAAEAAGCISRWMALSTGSSPDLRTAFTSDPKIEAGLKDAVQTMATEILANKQFGKIQAAPVLMMYTSYWAQILSGAGVIDSPNAVCIEPTIHFVDDRKLPAPLEGAYDDFLSWLKANPYGVTGSDNSTYGIAGFLESYSSDMQKKRTRLLPYNRVPNTTNVRTWNEQLVASTDMFPFPLKNSMIFAEAVNWGLWNTEIQELLGRLILLEETYYQEKKDDKARQQSIDRVVMGTLAKMRKQVYMETAKPILSTLARQTAEILSYVLEGSL